VIIVVVAPDLEHRKNKPWEGDKGTTLSLSTSKLTRGKGYIFVYFKAYKGYIGKGLQLRCLIASLFTKIN